MLRKTFSSLLEFEHRPGATVRGLAYRQLTMNHLQAWAAFHREHSGWTENGVLARLCQLRTAFNWASGEGGLVGTTPFSRGGRPVRLGALDMTLKRLATTEEEHAALLERARARSKGDFALLLELLHDTGVRPAEVYKATAGEWNPALQALVIDPADPANVGRLKNRRHLLRRGRKRVVRVPDRLAPRVAELAARRGEGRLFLTERGRPWPDNPGNINRRFKSLVRSANFQAPGSVRHGVCLYSYRHAYVTRYIQAGGDLMTLCELINTSVKMLEAHYSHLLEAHDRLLEAVNRHA
jgi:site-specific recombinase XerD